MVKSTRRTHNDNMPCPSCDHRMSRIIDTRYVAGSNHRRRRHQCKSCRHRWSTREVAAERLEELTRHAEAYRQIQRALRVESHGSGVNPQPTPTAPTPISRTRPQGSG